MSEDEFERRFDEAFDEAAKQHITIPDPSASWARVKAALDRRAKRRKRLRMLPYIAVSFLLGAVLFGSPVVTEAFNPLFQAMRSFQTGMVSFIFGSNTNHSTPMTKPPSDMDSITEGTVVTSGALIDKTFDSWEAAVQEVAFPPLSVQYVPEGFDIAEVLLFFRQEQAQSNHAVILYTNDSNERILVTIRLLEENSVLTSNAPKDAVIETVEINGSEAYLVITPERASLEYMLANLFISISGNLSKDEIIGVAEQIR